MSMANIVLGDGYSYEPEAIARYWRQRKGAVASRILQLLAISGKFLGSLAIDAATDKLKENEVKRAIEIRDIVTSLGNCYGHLDAIVSVSVIVLVIVGANIVGIGKQSICMLKSRDIVC